MYVAHRLGTAMLLGGLLLLSATAAWGEYEFDSSKVEIEGPIHFEKGGFDSSHSNASAPASAHQSAELVLQLGHTGGINSVAFSPDGRVLASGGKDGTVKLWDTKHGKVVQTLPAAGHASVAFSPDGRVLALGGSGDSTVKLWDLKRGQVVQTLSYRPMMPLLFTLDGQMLTWGSGYVELWDVKQGKVVQTLGGSEYSSKVEAFSPDGRVLAMQSGPETVALWDVKQGKVVRTLSVKGPYVTPMAFSPDGRVLAMQSGPETVALWDVKQEKVVRTLPVKEGYVTSMAFSPDGQVLALGNNAVQLWDVKRGQVVGRLRVPWSWSGIEVMAWSPDGQTLAVGSGRTDGTMQLWDVKRGKVAQTLRGNQNSLGVVALSPDGQTLAMGQEVAYFVNGRGRRSHTSVVLWDVPQGKVVRRVDGPGGWIQDMAWSPDGRTLAIGWEVEYFDISVEWTTTMGVGASAVGHTSVVLWDVPQGKVVRRMDGPGGRIRAMAWSPDGRTLAVNRSSMTLELWDVQRGEVMWRRDKLGEDEGLPAAMAFSSDGQTLIVGQIEFSPAAKMAGGAWLGDTSVVLWDVQRGDKKKGELWPDIDAKYVLLAMGLSTDGQILAVVDERGGKTLALWDVQRGAVVLTLRGPVGRVTSAALSTDRQTLTLTDLNGMVRLVDVNSGKVKISVVLLPEDEWFAYHPQTLVYNSSAQGDAYAAIRFGPALDSVSPLIDYRKELQRSDLREALRLPQPEIRPKRLHK